MNTPKWTVLYNIVSLESAKYIGTGWEFFDDQTLAQKCYQRHTDVVNCATLRPYHDATDRQHLGAVHRMMDTPLTAADYEEVLADHRYLVRQLDVLLNGAGAARQATLSDIVAQVRKEGIKAPDYTTHQHPDDAAIDRFAAAMKARMAEKRAEGRSGWDDPAEIPISYLEGLLENTPVGKSVDIGNYAMMLFNRNLT